MYDYQKNQRFFAQIADGLKEIGALELSELGAQKFTPEYRGIYFTATPENLYRINYCSRLFSRILAPLVSFKCRSADQLYKKAREIKWSDFLSTRKTFAIFSNVSHSTINNSHFASLKLKDAIVDYFRETSGDRPDIDSHSPDVWFNLYIHEDEAHLSLDTSGGSLHRRGYRKDSLEAPMQETVAATIIRMSEWDGKVPLLDPLCGSGTLIGEALMSYARIPAGFFREKFGFESLPDFDGRMWSRVKKEIDHSIRKIPDGLISGTDISPKAVEIAKTNLRNLPDGEKVNLKVIDFRESAGLQNGVIITNPPYGIRMGKKDELDLFYKELGDFLKHKCKNSQAYIYFGDREYIKKIGLRSSWKKHLEAGGLDGRLVKYELF